jgi:hypothetical protein
MRLSPILFPLGPQMPLKRNEKKRTSQAIAPVYNTGVCLAFSCTVTADWKLMVLGSNGRPSGGISSLEPELGPATCDCACAAVVVEDTTTVVAASDDTTEVEVTSLLDAVLDDVSAAGVIVELELELSAPAGGGDPGPELPETPIVKEAGALLAEAPAATTTVLAAACPTDEPTTEPKLPAGHGHWQLQELESEPVELLLEARTDT